ncbi:MAG: NRDE family protein [Nevskiaceae bacterium]
MCLIGFALRAHPKYELVIAANRDEFHDRPSASAAAWADHPQIFGGRDLRQKGSWLAVSTAGRLAAVTNVRRMVPPDPAAPSRGKLVAEFLKGGAGAAEFARQLAGEAENYSGFNLLLYDGVEMRYMTNAPEFRDEAVTPGVHALSNATLDTPWPKTRRLQQALEGWTADRWESFTPLLKALADRAPGAEAELPNTGVGKPLEKLLSAPFIVSPSYGTRCSTVVVVGSDRIDFTEKRFEPSGVEFGRTEQQLKRTA